MTAASAGPTYEDRGSRPKLGGSVERSRLGSVSGAVAGHAGVVENGTLRKAPGPVRYFRGGGEVRAGLVQLEYQPGFFSTAVADAAGLPTSFRGRGRPCGRSENGTLRKAPGPVRYFRGGGEVRAGLVQLEYQPGFFSTAVADASVFSYQRG